MSIHVMSWVLRNSNARLGDRLVLLVLADHAKDDGSSSWPSVSTIASEAHLSEKQVQRCLTSLKRANRIVKTGESKWGTNVYKVDMSEQRDKGDILSGATNPTSDEGQDVARTVLSTTISSSLPKEKKPREPNPVWDALEYIFGPVSTVRSAQTRRGKVCRSLTEAGATRDQIIARASAWPAHFDSATLTPEALEKHWDTLGRKPLRRAR